MSPHKRHQKPASFRTPQAKRSPRPLSRSKTFDTLSNDSQSGSSGEHTIGFSQLLKFGLSSDEMVTHHHLLSLLSSSRSEPIMRKPTWKNTKKVLESSASSSSRKSSRQPLHPVMDIGEFPLSDSREQELEPRLPSISELRRHARRHCQCEPVECIPSNDCSIPILIEPSPPSKRKLKMDAVLVTTTVPIFPRWSLTRSDVEETNSSSSERSSPSDLSSEPCSERRSARSLMGPAKANMTVEVSSFTFYVYIF